MIKKRKTNFETFEKRFMLCKDKRRQGRKKFCEEMDFFFMSLRRTELFEFDEGL
jgi:hypothetical protein